jgi:hypothetical protein
VPPALLPAPAFSCRCGCWVRRINLYVGVKSAGYTVREEFPIFLVVFAIPAAVALLAWWKLR